MSWGLGFSIVGVVVAGIIVGLLVSCLILKRQQKSLPFWHQHTAAPSLAETYMPLNNLSPLSSPTPIPRVDKPSTSSPKPVSQYSGKHPILIELENNLAIAVKSSSGILTSYLIDIWQNKRSEYDLFSSELLKELTEAYVDMVLANNIVWLVTELKSNSRDLTESYIKLSNKIGARLTRIMPAVRNAFN